jgi:hypothetical protein
LNSVECFTRFHRQFRNFIQQNSTNSSQNSSQINDQFFGGLVPLSGKSFPQENNAFTASAYFQQSPMLTIIKRRAPSGTINVFLSFHVLSRESHDQHQSCLAAGRSVPYVPPPPTSLSANRHRTQGICKVTR